MTLTLWYRVTMTVIEGHLQTMQEWNVSLKGFVPNFMMDTLGTIHNHFDNTLLSGVSQGNGSK